MGIRAPQHTFLVGGSLGVLTPFLFMPVRPGETLTFTEADISVQLDRVIQDTYSVPLIVDIGIFLVPLTLLQNAFSDQYIRAFAGEPPSDSTVSVGQWQGGLTNNYVYYDFLEHDLTAEIARTYFARDQTSDSTTDRRVPGVPIATEFLPGAAGNSLLITTETSGETTTATQDFVLDAITSYKTQRLNQTTYLETLNRFGVSGADARHIPEVIMWERRMLHPRSDNLVTGASNQNISGEADRTLSAKVGTAGTDSMRYVTSGVPAVSLGVGISETRDKRMRVNDPSVLVGCVTIRDGIQRLSRYFGSANGSIPTHMNLMYMADDWCPPGTGFNDAVRYLHDTVADEDGLLGFTAPNNVIEFDPMIYLFYGEGYSNLADNTPGQTTSIGSASARASELDSIFDGVGGELASRATAPTWFHFTKGLVRFEIQTDLDE